MTKMYKLHEFWSSFGWKAYNNHSVPDENATDANGDLLLPNKYITYEASSDDFGNEIAQTAILWHRSPSWAEITEEEELIANTISRGGVIIPYDGGAFWIRKGSPWAQRLNDQNDDSYRVIVLNYTIEYMD